MLACFSGCSAAEGDDAVAKREPPAARSRANSLAGETSPYLLLHAHNPVDWHPWGPEAFEKARRENKPIFLSIGYSSCYWCHVMERQVFSNEKIARYMNEHFVNVKVDREERPDIDDIYMTALIVYFQAIGSSQGGGWPLSMFLTPEGQPFAGGTYFPPEDQESRLGFSTVTERIVTLWDTRPDDLKKNAAAITQEVRRLMRPRLVLEPVELDGKLVENVVKSLVESADPVHGGVDFDSDQPNAPKFPVPAKLELLQSADREDGDESAARVLTLALDRMAEGGIYDHLGGGFHRYSTDREWRVPHFEKMLYDQAQLAEAYLEAWDRTRNETYRRVTEDVLQFVLRELTDPEGGFYSALDAETDGVEGKFYVWSAGEVDAALTPDDAKLFRAVYGIEERPAFEHGNVLRLAKPLSETAGDLGLSEEDLNRRLAGIRRTLLEIRQKRKPLLKDDKVLTSWNGLMIRAFANAGRVLNRADYVQAAERAATFVLTRLRDEDRHLQRSYRAGEARHNAYLDDYAFLISGLLALHEAAGEEKWLNAARRLSTEQSERFWDEQGKAFYFTSHDHEELLARTKNGYDSVLPSGNSIAVRNLVRLAGITGEKQFLESARETLEVFAPQIPQSPRSMTQMALALSEYLDAEAGGRRTSEHRDTLSPFAKGGLRRAVITLASAQSDDDVAAKKDEDLVTAKAYLSVDRLPAGKTAHILVLLQVREGWHINTNPADPDYLLPTELSIASTQGLKLTKIRYPEGRTIEVEGIDEPVHVYEGSVAIRGVLEVPAKGAGQTEQLEIRVRYQACNDRRCLAPTTVKLTGKIPIARAGDPVKPANEKLFPEMK